MISYDDAVRTIMREHRVDEITAALMVADIYPALEDGAAEVRAAVSFDAVEATAADVFTYTPPAPAGKPVPIDDERSPAGALVAQAARTQAQIDGDRYRALSRGTSMHTVEG